MPRGNAPSVFVSSTCYDLAQVRTDIREFANSNGLDPIMSEFETFPVNPDANTINNCIEAVRNRADLFVLIVGGRYGSIADTGKSITNMEFNEARAKGIPKYVFVKESILNLLSVWRDNPESNYSSVVDTPKLFDFISELKDSGEMWVFPFSSAQDIVRILREQLSFLFSNCLDLRRRLNENRVDLAHFKSRSLQLAIEKPRGWEYLLFAQLLRDSIEEYTTRRLDVDLGISFGEPIVLDKAQDVPDWVSSRLRWISSTIQQLSSAINSGFIKALGEPGEPSDIKRMIHLASRVGEGYNQLLDWRLQFFRVVVDDKFKRLIELVSELSSNAVDEIESFSRNLFAQIEELIENEHKYEKGAVVKLTLTLTVPDTAELHNELNRLTKIFERKVRKRGHH